MRIGRILITAILLLCLMSLFTPAAAAAEPLEITLNVKQTFTAAGTAAPPNETFSYRLTPELQGNPMPPGSETEGCSFDITGTADKSVGIEFTAAGVYTYELSHTTAPAPGYTYDQELYTLKIAVNGDLTYTMLIYKKDGSKTEDIRYGHAYGNGALPGDPETITDPPDSHIVKPEPKTGDGFRVGLYTALLFAAGITALLIRMFINKMC